MGGVATYTLAQRSSPAFSGIFLEGRLGLRPEWQAAHVGCSDQSLICNGRGQASYIGWGHMLPRGEL